ncbi:unnamed protein product [Darwinula stevensoni]|uniref:C-type lectin domain-containing protein n=1 Tax=Darwinula stevensoni TaxID=69355 RepID=A0A7R9FNB1_9CRUS|nr:unnamed protein product [Darwinula stevensoni]CAG0896290.1 unnamed protein product [Darwinula stevensoni]
MSLVFTDPFNRVRIWKITRKRSRPWTGKYWRQLGRNMLVLKAKTEELAKQISQLKSENEHLVSLRDDYKILKHDFENMRHATGKLGNDCENMRKEHENLKSSFQEHILERDKLQLQLNTTEGRLQYLEAISLQITPRTCQTLADLGVTRTGEYFVDPDGVLIGDAPIKVICDMETDPVATIVLHDSMGNTAIDRCADPGCYNHSIKYGSPMKQMVALIQHSKSCEQYIRVSPEVTATWIEIGGNGGHTNPQLWISGYLYDCFSSALTTGVIHYAWWVDRHGEPQYYWDGSKAGHHKCSCGLFGNCTDTNFPCNCDAKPPHWESDSGAITNATALPITELRFGGLQFEGQKANYTLGGLTCKGKIPPPKNPAQSCSTLRQVGNAHPGYYMVNSKKGRLEVVMCRMDLEETESKFQVETNARIAGVGFLHGKVTPPDNPAQSCSTLRQAGNAHPGYYMIDSKKSRLDVVMCRMDLEETDPKFQVETSVHVAGEGTVSLIDVQSTTFHLLKQDAKLWPLAGTRKDVVNAMNARVCGSICHSLGMICNAFNWYPKNFTCEFVNILSATLQDAPGAMVYISAFVEFNVCQTPPPSMENRTMNFSYGWNGILPAPLLSEVSYDCPRHSRCPPPLPLKAKCVGFNMWKILNQDVTPPCPGSAPLAQGYKFFQEDGRFYKYYERGMNWTEASQVCCLDGARLASDTSPTVYKAIRSVAPDTNLRIWQGATDELVEGTWIYEDPNESESSTFGLHH